MRRPVRTAHCGRSSDRRCRPRRHAVLGRCGSGRARAAVRQRPLRARPDRLHIPLYRPARSGAPRDGAVRRVKADRVRPRERQAVHRVRKHGRSVRCGPSRLSNDPQCDLSGRSRQPRRGHGRQYEDGRPVRGDGLRGCHEPAHDELDRLNNQRYSGATALAQRGTAGSCSQQDTCRF